MDRICQVAPIARGYSQNGISISSASFAGLTAVIDKQTMLHVTSVAMTRFWHYLQCWQRRLIRSFNQAVMLRNKDCKLIGSVPLSVWNYIFVISLYSAMMLLKSSEHTQRFLMIFKIIKNVIKYIYFSIKFKKECSI